jgi:hypothetical protein
MWRESIRKTASDEFAAFLESEPYIRLRQRESHFGTPPCLLDIIELWVASGNATHVCPTYETFLLTVLDIVDRWQREMRKTVLGASLWCTGPHDESIEILFLNSCDGIQVEDSWSHPVLNQQNYEFQQAYVRAHPDRIAL